MMSDETKRLPNVHPGEVLEEDFLKPLGVSHYRLAKEIGVSQRRIDEIVAGKRSITAETALLLGRYFGIEPQTWLNLQASYDLEESATALRERLDGIRPLEQAAA